MTQVGERGCYWHVADKGQGYCLIPYNAQHNPPQQGYLSKVLSLRNFNLASCLAYSVQSKNAIQREEEEEAEDGGWMLPYKGDEFTAAASCYGECQATRPAVIGAPSNPRASCLSTWTIGPRAPRWESQANGPRRAVKHLPTRKFFNTRSHQTSRHL